MIITKSDSLNRPIIIEFQNIGFYNFSLLKYESLLTNDLIIRVNF